MAIPQYQILMLPLLQLAGDQQEHSLREATDKLADAFSLTDQERTALLASGQQEIFNNRVGWARTYLKKAGLLEPTRRAHFAITPRGLELLARHPETIDVELLNQFEEFRQFRARKPAGNKNDDAGASSVDEGATPEEVLENAYGLLRDSLASDVLQQVLSASPAMFERLVVELLLRMGYGGSRQDAGRAIGKSGDEGIDGIIKEDRLGLDVIYIQAKRWQATVGRPEVQKFAGALQGQRAKRGVMITTSAFTGEALAYAAQIDNRIILMDGELLAELMIDHDLGVSRTATYEVKRIDADFFTD